MKKQLFAPIWCVYSDGYLMNLYFDTCCRQNTVDVVSHVSAKQCVEYCAGSVGVVVY